MFLMKITYGRAKFDDISKFLLVLFYFICMIMTSTWCGIGTGGGGGGWGEWSYTIFINIFVRFQNF